MSAKICGKIAMAFASVLLVAMLILKGFKYIDIEMWDVIITCIAIVGMWAPTYVSTWIDKIKELKEIK